MDVAVQVPHTGDFAAPGFVRDYCQAAEAAGFTAVWTVDHLVVPDRVESRYPLAATPQVVSGDAMRDTMGANLEQNTVLAVAAAVTSTIELGTAVSVVTNRHPVLNARQLATIDLFAGGRLVYGVGVGWLREEGETMGADWRRRGAQAEEHVRILRRIWSADGRSVDFDGDFWAIPAMDPRPLPPRGTIPVLIGGYSPAALDRVARLGDGWVTARISPERFTRLREDIARACERHGRDLEALRLVAWASTARLRSEARDVLRGDPGEVRAELRRYAAAGVTQLRVGGDVSSPDESIAWLEEFGRLFLTEDGA
ncbi:TIGR03619 family F420-dependent LLM class oxidoreductase [Frankia sp. CNm7]|uniref:TIGR03619 family F420-dependent LLM class oxidoreductase n=1 Tax=Frankia nepalensis TaxID=1836974 RepID=UPI001931296B|nr:TIGR03619 family F420-dependent LLM class oxidoreductase [Frankia nepalensis]MBL7523064.1 TIGR03619 family F420-dependent LLM class oxidoreductase [Frankia nepalensis]